MSSWAEEILAMAKRLPREDQLRLASELQHEDAPRGTEEVDAAWQDEVTRRVRKFLDGETTMLDGEDVYERLRSKYAR